MLAYKNRKEALQSEMFSIRSHDSQQKKIQALLAEAPAHLDLSPLFMAETAETAEEQQPFGDFQTCHQNVSDFQTCRDKETDELHHYKSALYKNLAKKDDRLLTIWNILDDHSFAELQLMQKQLPTEMFLLQILQKNVQNMIHVFKRAVSPACEQFLLWFKQELTVNYRFRTIYL